jgi:hypothetical protein
MFNVHGRRRVHVNVRGGHLIAHIDRQNSRGWYFCLMCLSTIAFGQFCDILWGAAVRYPHDAVYVTLPMFALGLTFYILAFAEGVWGAFGIEEIRTEAGSLRWTRKALNWTRIQD